MIAVPHNIISADGKPSSKIYKATQPRPIEARAFVDNPSTQRLLDIKLLGRKRMLMCHNLAVSALWLHPAAFTTLCNTFHSPTQGQLKTLLEGALGLTTEVRGMI